MSQPKITNHPQTLMNTSTATRQTLTRLPIVHSFEPCSAHSVNGGQNGQNGQSWTKPSPAQDYRARAAQQTLEVRFWARVNKDGPIPEHRLELGKCWLWTAFKDRDGYGRPIVNGRKVGAHRLAYLFAKGPIPQGLEALHECDNPSCVNPAHIVAGTHHRNMMDRGARGRTAGGERNGRAKVTEETVRQIKAEYAAGAGPKALAKKFVLNLFAVKSMVYGKTWRHVKVDAPQPALQPATAEAAF